MWKSAVNGQPDARATRHLAMLSVPSCGSVTPFGWPGPCQPPASPRVQLLAARRPPRPPLRMQGRWGRWFPHFVMARSFVRPTSAISAAPRRTAHVGRTAAESCCSQDGSADRTSTRLQDAPRLLEKRAAPLLGGGEANLWTLLSFMTSVHFWPSWSPLICTRLKPHPAPSSLMCSVESMHRCRHYCGGYELCYQIKS